MIRHIARYITYTYKCESIQCVYLTFGGNLYCHSSQAFQDCDLILLLLAMHVLCHFKLCDFPPLELLLKFFRQINIKICVFLTSTNFRVIRCLVETCQINNHARISSFKILKFTSLRKPTVNNEDNAYTFPSF